jgi:hypothetical protein
MEMKKAAKAEKAAAVEAEQRRMQERERARAKEARKAQRDSEKVMLDTKLQPHTTKLVSKTTTSVSHTTFHPATTTVPTKPMATSVKQHRRVVGAEPPEPPPHRRKSPLHETRLSGWLQKDRQAAALALQRAWRRHHARHVRLLLAFERAAERKTNREQEFTTKVQTNTSKQRAHIIKPCRYHPCRKPWCHFGHEPGQQLTEANGPNRRPAPT